MAAAAISGGNRGIGLEVARQLAERGFDVVLGSRSAARGDEALRALGLPDDVAARVRVAQLDLADVVSVDRFAAELDELDVLVNNAAIHYDTWQSAAEADLDVVREALETNVLGAWRLTQACLPLLRVRRAPADRQRLQPGRLAGRHARGHAGVQGLQGRPQRPDPDARGRASARRRAGQQ